MLHKLLNPLGRFLGMPEVGFPGGVDLPDNKLTADQPIATCPQASLYILPVKQHIGDACEPLVEVGDHVLLGQTIARSSTYLSAPVHAPTSGKVVKIEEHAIAHPSGMGLPCIFIEPDGKDTRDESQQPITDYRNTDPAELRDRIRRSGITGLGGASFPTFIKLIQDQHNPIHTVILNGVECEPYLTNDHRVMLEYSREIVCGLDILLHTVGATRGIIAIEDNKPDAAEKVRDAVQAAGFTDVINVQVLPTRYPQGGEKQLIESVTGKQVPAGRLPMHIGILCQNVATTKAVYDAVVRGRPLTERVVTISGDAVPNPGNMRLRIGTPIRNAFSLHGLDNFQGLHLLHGGPMMGERLHSHDVPIVKSTTGLLAFRHPTLMLAHHEEDPCIRCGHCVEACPASLVPNLLADHCRNEQFEKAETYNIFDCIECGACSYVCPSHIPLVHYFRFGKGQLAAIRREKAFAEASRERSEAREARIAREKAEKASRRQRVRKDMAPASDEKSE